MPLIKLSTNLKIELKTNQYYQTNIYNVLNGSNKFGLYFENLKTPNYPMQTLHWATEFWIIEKQAENNHEAYLINVLDENSNAWIQAIIYQYPWQLKQIFLTIPRGPACSPNWCNTSPEVKNKLELEFITELNNLAGLTKAVFIKIEPTWDLDQVLNLKTNESETDLANLKFDFNNELFAKLDLSKIHSNTKFLQPPYSRTIELNVPNWIDRNENSTFEEYWEHCFEPIVAQFESKTRYNARLAKKKGLHIKWDKTEAGFESFWEIMQKTAERQNFKPYSKKYYHNVFKNSWVDLVLVYTPEGKVTNSWMGSFVNGMGMYLYGGSDMQFSNLKGAELIHTAAVIRAIQKCGTQTANLTKAYYDMGGSSLLDGAIPAWDGYSKFKKGFGGKIVEYLPHTFDYVYKPFIYNSISFLIPKIKTLLGHKKSSADMVLH